MDKTAANLKRKTLKFVQSDRRRDWLRTAKVSVYVRKSRRATGESVATAKMKRFFDIADITIANDLRGKGLFSEYLSFCQDLLDFDGVVVENVISPSMLKIMEHYAQKDPRWFIRDQSFFWERLSQRSSQHLNQHLNQHLDQ